MPTLSRTGLVECPRLNRAIFDVAAKSRWNRMRVKLLEDTGENLLLKAAGHRAWRLSPIIRWPENTIKERMTGEGDQDS